MGGPGTCRRRRVLSGIRSSASRRATPSPRRQGARWLRDHRMTKAIMRGMRAFRRSVSLDRETLEHRAETEAGLEAGDSGHRTPYTRLARRAMSAAFAAPQRLRLGRSTLPPRIRSRGARAVGARSVVERRSSRAPGRWSAAACPLSPRRRRRFAPVAQLDAKLARSPAHRTRADRQASAVLRSSQTSLRRGPMCPLGTSLKACGGVTSLLRAHP